MGNPEGGDKPRTLLDEIRRVQQLDELLERDDNSLGDEPVGETPDGRPIYPAAKPQEVADRERAQKRTPRKPNKRSIGPLPIPASDQVAGMGLTNRAGIIRARSKR